MIEVATGPARRPARCGRRVFLLLAMTVAIGSPAYGQAPAGELSSARVDQLRARMAQQCQVSASYFALESGAGRTRVTLSPGLKDEEIACLRSAAEGAGLVADGFPPASSGSSRRVSARKLEDASLRTRLGTRVSQRVGQ